MKDLEYIFEKPFFEFKKNYHTWQKIASPFFPQVSYQGGEAWISRLFNWFQLLWLWQLVHTSLDEDWAREEHDHKSLSRDKFQQVITLTLDNWDPRWVLVSLSVQSIRLATAAPLLISMIGHLLLEHIDRVHQHTLRSETISVGCNYFKCVSRWLLGN